EEDDVFDLVFALGEGGGGGFHAGADVDAAAAGTDLADEVDGGFALGEGDGADGVVGPGVYGDDGDFVEVVEEFDDADGAFGGELDFGDAAFLHGHAAGAVYDDDDGDGGEAFFVFDLHVYGEGFFEGGAVVA